MFESCFNPFLKKFPEDKLIWKLNKKRIEGFLKFTSVANKKGTSSIELKAAKQIARLNNLGFITMDSQEGIISEVQNPKYVSGEKKEEPTVNKKGIRSVLSINSERAYCDGFIRTALLDAFEVELKACNFNSIVLRYPREGERITLTKEYIKYEDGSEYKDDFTRSPEYSINDLQTYIIDEMLINPGYYIGPPLSPIPVDLNNWTYILAIDMDYGHHALEKNGLFMCIERALLTSLKNVSKGGSGKRRTMKKRVKALRNNCA